MNASSDSPRPWLRFGLEGVVIVVSILLAFGIEAWWQDRQDAARAGAYVTSILEDVEVNRDRIAITRAEVNREMAAAVRLGEWLAGDGSDLEPDSVLALLVTSFAIAPFVPANQGYDQVVAAGDLGLLPEGLRAALRQWHEAVEELRSSESQSREDRHRTAVPFLIEETSLRRAFSASTEQEGAPFGESAFPAGTEALLGNRRLDNLLTYRIVFLNGQLTELETMDETLAEVHESLR